VSSGEVTIRDISMTFKTRNGPFKALDNMSLQVEAGEFVCLVGHSGCGKSTLLNLVAGLLLPTMGSVTCNGHLVTKPGPDRGMVFQNHSLLPWLTCLDNVMLGLESVNASHQSKSELKARAMSAIEMVHLGHAANKFPYEISGGMKQRVGIARAIAVEPRVLLLDEPFGALDALTRASLQDELNKIVASINTTVVMVTHDIDEAILLADRVVLMTNGPAARIGEIVDVDLPRPRDRMKLQDLARYHELKKVMLDFLYRRHAHKE
jgi:nitrate/nitrite transport system ATP-binding protein